MIKMTRNTSRVKITSHLQTKHELIKQVIKSDISARQSWPSQGQNENINKNLYLALNYTKS